MIESLEPRRLLTNYSFSVLSDLTTLDGAETSTAPVLDAQGDLFDTSHAGGAAGGGVVYELPVGQHTVQPLSVVASADNAPSYGNVTIDGSGDIFWSVNPSSTIINEIPHGGSPSIFYVFSSPGTNGAVISGGLTIRQPAVVLSGIPIGMNFFGMTAGGGLNGEGTIFEISDISTPSEVVIVPFPASRPELGTGVTRDAAGDLFGTYVTGGADNIGEIFEAPAGGGVLLTPAAFDGANGIDPNGPLLYDSKSGDFFGTTEGGGANNDGVIYKFDGTNITVVASFDGANTGFAEGSLYEDAAGDLFGTASDGGANSIGTVFELPAGSSTIKTLVTFDGSNKGQSPIGGLVADSNGNLYGVTGFGGAFGDGVVYELSPLPASQLKFDSQPQGTETGDTLAPVSVEVDDADGDVVSSNTSAVTVALTTPGGATLHGTLTQNAVGGVASFGDLSLTTPGTYTLTATDGSLAGATSTSFTVSLPPSQLKFVSQPQDAQTDQTLGTVTIDVDNADGNIVSTDNSSITLNLTGSPNGAQLTGTVLDDADNGVLTLSNLGVDQAGTFTLTATDGSLTPGVSDSFTISFPPPHVAIVPQPVVAVAGTNLGFPVVDLIGADDTIDTTVKPTKVTITTTDPKGKVLRFTAMSKKGVASFKMISFKTAGTYTLSAAGGTFASGSSSFVVVPAAAKKMVFGIPPVSVAAGAAFEVQAELFDAFGNLAIYEDSTAAISFVGNPKGATLGGGTSVTVTNGLATFAELSITPAAKAYTLKIVDGKLHVTSKRFAVT